MCLYGAAGFDFPITAIDDRESRYGGYWKPPMRRPWVTRGDFVYKRLSARSRPESALPIEIPIQRMRRRAVLNERFS